MKTLLQLAEQFPEKTGAELLEIIQKQEAEHQQKLDERNSEIEAIIDHLNTDEGRYLMGSYGATQRWVYKVTFAAMMSDGSVSIDYEAVYWIKSPSTDTMELSRKSERHNGDIHSWAYLDMKPATEKDWDMAMTYITDFSRIIDNLMGSKELMVGDEVILAGVPKTSGGYPNPLYKATGRVTNVQKGDIDVHIEGYGSVGCMPSTLVKTGR